MSTESCGVYCTCGHCACAHDAAGACSDCTSCNGFERDPDAMSDAEAVATVAPAAQPSAEGNAQTTASEVPVTSGVMHIQRLAGLGYAQALRVQAVLNPLEMEVASLRTALAAATARAEQIEGCYNELATQFRIATLARDEALAREQQARTALDATHDEREMYLAALRETHSVIEDYIELAPDAIRRQAYFRAMKRAAQQPPRSDAADAQETRP